MNNNIFSNMIIKRICAITKINATPLQKTQRKNRERNAIAIKTTGRTLYLSNKKEYISDANNIIFLPKDSTYSWTCLDPGECLKIEFETDIDLPCCEIASFKITNQAEFIKLFSRTEHAWNFNKPAYTMKCMAGLYDILAKLMESIQLDYHVITKIDIIKPSIEYLEGNYNDPDLNNEKLSKISGISTVYFRKIFTGIYNCSPMKYIQTVRIEKAKDMLLSDYYSIASIAEAVGFANIYHFSKSFKKTTGYTPSEFARRYSIANYTNSEL